MIFNPLLTDSIVALIVLQCLAFLIQDLDLAHEAIRLSSILCRPLHVPLGLGDCSLARHGCFSGVGIVYLHTLTMSARPLELEDRTPGGQAVELEVALLAPSVTVE